MPYHTPPFRPSTGRHLCEAHAAGYRMLSHFGHATSIWLYISHDWDRHEGDSVMPFLDTADYECLSEHTAAYHYYVLVTSKLNIYMEGLVAAAKWPLVLNTNFIAAVMKSIRCISPDVAHTTRLFMKIELIFIGNILPYRIAARWWWNLSLRFIWLFFTLFSEEDVYWCHMIRDDMISSLILSQPSIFRITSRWAAILWF